MLIDSIQVSDVFSGILKPSQGRSALVESRCQASPKLVGIDTPTGEGFKIKARIKAWDRGLVDIKLARLQPMNYQGEKKRAN